jgi:transposase-like protein
MQTNSVTSSIKSCFFCNSLNIVKHGKSNQGISRFRCKDCSKTFNNSTHTFRNENISEYCENYLKGSTLRNLAIQSHTSVIRLNKKIRTFLSTCPDWETYLDKNVLSKKLKVVYLSGKKFASRNNKDGSNYIYLATAIDALSSLVIGYEIGFEDSEIVWSKLISRLSLRNYECGQFVSNGNSNIENPLQEYYPNAYRKLNYGQLIRDKEINCCLTNLTWKRKLINDAISFYSSLKNQRLNSYLNTYYNTDFPTYISKNESNFLVYVNSKCDKDKFHLDNFIEDFDIRFKKFRRLKENPLPIINGWIALKMMSNYEFGFNRLSLLNQIPSQSNFKNFTESKDNLSIKYPANSVLIRNFVFEIGVRTLRLPISPTKCELNLAYCFEF